MKRPCACLCLLLLLAFLPARASAELRADTLDALDEALAAERRSRQQYRAVIARHGPVMPFARIAEAEARSP